MARSSASRSRPVDGEGRAVAAGKVVPVQRDFSGLSLKPDHAQRPLWISPEGQIILEATSEFYHQAYDFLIAIGEPVSRPTFIHEYGITPYSLFAAASVGLTTEDIIDGLNKFSKTELHPKLVHYIKEQTERCGKVKLLLDQGKFYIESKFPEILNELLRQPEILSARVDNLSAVGRGKLGSSGFIETKVSDGSGGLRIPGGSGKRVDQKSAMGLMEIDPDSEDALYAQDDFESDAVLEEKFITVFSFQIDATRVELVRKTCRDLGYPTLEEYEFRKDSQSENLPIALRPSAFIRSYQEKSLSKMFGNGRARSGIIVLPCGAGKTLVGITATSTVRKNTLVFCNTAVSVDQWKKQFLKFANIPEENICLFTSLNKDPIRSSAPVLLITTYNMLAYSGNRSAKALEILREIESREWGLVILDEVHVAPARTFRMCLNMTKSKCKLGLTATLLREDDLIEDLFFLIGPKLYEANWLSLQKQGFLATVQCVEIRCPMTEPFCAEYLKADSRKQPLLYVMNPNKFKACQYLIDWHESRGDKVLVFSDIIFALEKYAKDLKKPFLCGSTSERERLDLLSHFQVDDNFNTLFISKVGDTSIDLPDVNVIIQISSHFASRRQEAQRLGRILRPKSSSSSRFNAFFYSLVSEDTKEVRYATKRQSFLVDQGYSFQVITYQNLMDPETEKMLKYHEKDDQLRLLSNIMALDSSAADIEDLGDLDEKDTNRLRLNAAKARRRRDESREGGLAALAGGTGVVYSEFKKTASNLTVSRKRQDRKRMELDEQRRREAEELRREAEESR